MSPLCTLNDSKDASKEVFMLCRDHQSIVIIARILASVNATPLDESGRVGNIS